MLTQMGLPLVPISAAANAAINALDDDARARLLHLGMLMPDQYDEGDGI